MKLPLARLCPTKRKSRHELAGAALLVVAALLGGCAVPEREAPAAAGETESQPQPGNSATYRRLQRLRSCAKLQAELTRFTAMHGNSTPGSERADAALAYSDAAAERMRELGCGS